MCLLAGTTAIVGTPLDDPSGTIDAGAAYVFDTTTGNLISTLVHPSPTASDNFGQSVAVSGTVAVVGVPFYNSSSGIAYVFDTTTGNLIATLNNPDPSGADKFGDSVSVSGTIAVVGAPFDSPGGTGSAGTAYAFDTTTGNLISTFNKTTPVASDFFGISVAVSGTTAVVGADWDDTAGASAAGAAYTFDTTTGNLIASLVNPDPTSSDYFGGREWPLAVILPLSVLILMTLAVLVLPERHMSLMQQQADCNQH